jgi:hypothetical protein
MILAYGITLESVGFLISSFGFLFGGILLLYRKGPAKALGLSLLSIVLVYIIFRLIFRVILPEGIIPERRILADLGAFFSRLVGGP